MRSALPNLGAVGPKNVSRRTKRVQEVLGLLVRACGNPEIAGRLFVSHEAVEHHVARVLVKLGVRDRAEAAVLADRMSS
jgi:DNA-binding NarL/FixJ family response regulator